MNKTELRLTRRQMIQLLGALGISGPAAVELAAQSRKAISPEIVRTAMAIIDQDFSEEQVKIIATALQRRLDEMQLLRDLDLDDMLAPATVFMAKGW